MRLTSYTDYAFRVLLFTSAAQETVTIGKIATAYGISKDHLRKVVHALSQHGYLTTTQGRNGGIALAMPAEQINVGEIVRQFEPTLLVECFNAETNSCPISGVCNLKHVLYKAQQSFLDTLGQYYLSDITSNPKLQTFVREHTGA